MSKVKKIFKIVKRILAFFSFICILVIVFLVVNSRQPGTISVPERYPNIPQHAVWRGAQDEGFWIEIVSVDAVNETCRIRIYNDYMGLLKMDAEFKDRDSCLARFDSNSIIADSVEYVEIDLDSLNDYQTVGIVHLVNKDCKLISFKSYLVE